MTTPPSALWPVIHRMFAVHTAVYRLTGGRIGHTLPGLPPMLLLDHVGAKSGKRRTTPLLYMNDGEAHVIVASKGGHPRHPAWFHNLRANPDTTIQVGARKLQVTARVATQAERKRLWPKVVRVYRGYEDYQRATERKIPLVMLEPR